MMDNQYKEGIIINNHNITTNGNDYIINANNEARIFNITGNNIKFKNINFMNAKTEGNGMLFMHNPIK
ncbi:hypothetical protein PXD04_09185 [Methanosphaera sp. ISO3-F5]|uniref:hypothetical protein n=1 Tax=Methanosphaera sp. ISO3-F5 TaxID=1452353 RepID=UPI002B258D78|nr:hypothetical protein [Methanosphaera sp. ISO3-F5]WQH63862.1 hypothetical protein PXD04_09185 [Methanosphaera sp. ISO3-F5]